MADLVSVLVLRTIKKDCPSNSCPYRQGDGVHARRISPKLEAGLKHRVADGNEVKILEKKVKALTLALKNTLEIAKKRKLTAQELTQLEKVLNET